MAVSSDTGVVPLDPAGYQQTFDERVAGLIAEASGRSRGFRRRLDEAGVAGAALTDVASLDRLPVLTKDQLLGLQAEQPPFGGLLADDAELWRCFQSPGPVYEPELVEDGGDGWRWAPALRAAGFGPGDRVMLGFGFHLSPAGAMFEAACHELGAAVLPAGIGAKDLQVRACADLAVTAFIGPPSYLKALFETADEGGVELGLQRAFVTAEPLPPSLRDVLEARVPTVRQGYGTAETGNLGYECHARDGLHVPTDALVQICDLSTGAAVDDQREGQLVVTLFRSAYPIVRFGTGDLSGWSATPCDCGLATPRIRGWTGRVGDAVKVKGMFLHPRQVAQAMERLPEVARYRVVIDRIDHKDVLRCEVVLEDGHASHAPDTIAEVLRDALRFQVDVEVVGELEDETPLVDVRTWD